MNNYYVYEHWRPDTNRPFYVGKGKGKRAYKPRRNPYWRNVVEKLKREGFRIRVKYIQMGLSELEAFNLERYQIKLWRTRGIELTNMTDGGEGTSGKNHSPETIAKIVANRYFSPESRAKIAEANRRRPADVVAAQIEALANINRGRPRPAEVRFKIGAAHHGRVYSPEVRANMSAAQQRRVLSLEASANIAEANRRRRGRVVSVSTRTKLSNALKSYWDRRREGILL